MSELGLITGVALLVVLGNLVIADGSHHRPLMPGGFGLMCVSVASLVWRKHQPVLVLALTAASAAVYYILDYPAGFEPVPFVVALYGAITQGYRLIGLLAAVFAVALVAGVQLVTEPRVGPTGLAALLGWLAALIVFGEVVRSRRAYLASVEQRAIDAERTRDTEALRRVVEERLRIARELHDALAHHISVISVQAGAALLHKDTKPELAHEALPIIREAAGSALRELRATLGVLRSHDHEAARTPRPSLERLDELVDGMRAAGQRVETDVRGEPRPLPTEVDLAAYRIVQEALTNVGKHAGAATATVRVDHGRDELELRVDDDGPSRKEPVRDNGGNGLLGMTERVAAIGGTLEVGPRENGGFRVYARIPLDGVGGAE